MSFLRFAIVSVLVVVAAACGTDPAEPSMMPPADPPAGGPSITIPVGAAALGDRAYVPAALDVAVGGTVTWINSDAIPHTSTSNIPVWDSGILAPGARFSATFPVAGTFAYHCTLHPNMVGSVVVR